MAKSTQMIEFVAEGEPLLWRVRTTVSFDSCSSIVCCGLVVSFVFNWMCRLPSPNLCTVALPECWIRDLALPFFAKLFFVCGVIKSCISLVPSDVKFPPLLSFLAKSLSNPWFRAVFLVSLVGEFLVRSVPFSICNLLFLGAHSTGFESMSRKIRFCSVTRNAANAQLRYDVISQGEALLDSVQSLVRLRMPIATVS